MHAGRPWSRRPAGGPIWADAGRPRGLQSQGPVWAAPQLVRFFCHAVLFVLGLVAFLVVLIWFVRHPAHREPPSRPAEEAALQDLLPDPSP